MKIIANNPAPGETAIDATAPPLSERRRDQRFQVELSAILEAGGRLFDVVISDLSASGALVECPVRLRHGAALILHIESLGALPARVVHAGRGFCGVQFLRPEVYRDRVAAWLAREVGAPPA